MDLFTTHDKKSGNSRLTMKRTCYENNNSNLVTLYRKMQRMAFRTSQITAWVSLPAPWSWLERRPTVFTAVVPRPNETPGILSRRLTPGQRRFQVPLTETPNQPTFRPRLGEPARALSMTQLSCGDCRSGVLLKLLQAVFAPLELGQQSFTLFSGRGGTAGSRTQTRDQEWQPRRLCGT